MVRAEELSALNGLLYPLHSSTEIAGVKRL